MCATGRVEDLCSVEGGSGTGGITRSLADVCHSYRAWQHCMRDCEGEGDHWYPVRVCASSPQGGMVHRAPTALVGDTRVTPCPKEV